MKFYNMDYETFQKLMVQPSVPPECINLAHYDQKNYKNTGSAMAWWYHAIPFHNDNDNDNGIDYSDWFIEVLNMDEIINNPRIGHMKTISKSDVLKIIQDPSDFSYEEFVIMCMLLDT